LVERSIRIRLDRRTYALPIAGDVRRGGDAGQGLPPERGSGELCLAGGREQKQADTAEAGDPVEDIAWMGTVRAVGVGDLVRVGGRRLEGKRRQLELGKGNAEGLRRSLLEHEGVLLFVVG
jgi:hypothetical protein